MVIYLDIIEIASSQLPTLQLFQVRLLYLFTNLIQISRLNKKSSLYLVCKFELLYVSDGGLINVILEFLVLKSLGPLGLST